MADNDALWANATHAPVASGLCKRAANSAASTHYVMGAMQQKAAANGQLREVIFGRNEAGLHHFHQHYRKALGQPLLEPIHAPAGARP